MYARLLLFKLFNNFLLVFPFSLALSIVFGPIFIDLGLGHIWPWANFSPKSHFTTILRSDPWVMGDRDWARGAILSENVCDSEDRDV